MLAPHKNMWSGDLGKIRATEHLIDLTPDHYTKILIARGQNRAKYLKTTLTFS